ncbi:MAG: acetate--CoA ligase family protein, partial [Methanoregula sp.]|nr:acetate--CoA ligase family protein [Methanoregula sp.]
MISPEYPIFPYPTISIKNGSTPHYVRTAMTRTLLSEAEGYALLAAATIPVPDYKVVTDKDSAARAADAMGYPVVMKVISPDIVHKSDAGGVVTGISSAAEARSAFDRISRQVNTHSPGATIAGIIVEQQKAPGLELIIGGKTDPTFGKVITAGIGGKMVELLKDVAIRILPVDEPECYAMIRELRGYPLIAGYRDEPGRDQEALVRIIGAAAEMFLSDPLISEFDINPLILYETGGCAVDARVYREDAPAPEETAPIREMPADLLDIHSIAVVGASQDPNKVGYAICRNLLTF